jgi:hypothetical protein
VSVEAIDEDVASIGTARQNFAAAILDGRSGCLFGTARLLDCARDLDA